MREFFLISLSIYFIALLQQCSCFSPQRQHCYFESFASTVRVSRDFGPRSSSHDVLPRNNNAEFKDEADRSRQSNLTSKGYLDSLSPNNNQKNQDEASKGSSIFKDSWSAAASAVTNVAESGANEFKSAANAASAGIGSAASAVTNVVGDGVNAASAGIGSAATVMTNAVGVGVDAASAGIGSAASTVTDAVGAGADTLTNVVGEGMNAATTGIGTAASTVNGVVGTGASTVGIATSTVSNVIETGASAVTNAVGTGAGKVGKVASWIDSQAKLGTQMVGSQAKSLVLKFTGKDDYQFGDVAKETFRRILSQEVSISDMILLLKILLAVGASIGPLAEVLPFAILLQGLNLSMEKHIGGKVLEAFATSLDTRLISAFSADDKFLLGDAVKRSMLSGVLAFTGKESYQAGDLQRQIATGGQEQLNIVLDPELEAWDKAFTESIEIQKQKEELALLYTDTNGNPMDEEAAKELDMKLAAELEEWSSVFRSDYSDFGL